MENTTITSAPVLHPLVASSIDPTKVSATVEGFLGSIAGIVMIVVTVYHFPLTASQYANFVQEFSAAAAAVATAWSAIYMLFGLFRKALAYFAARKTVVAQIVTTTKTIVPAGVGTGVASAQQ